MGAAPQVSYSQVVQRLEEVVKRLEGGDLSLEDSLKVFEEGIGLVRRGEKLLGEAEKRIEILLGQEGEGEVAPLDPERSKGSARVPPATEDEDVPF